LEEARTDLIRRKLWASKFAGEKVGLHLNVKKTKILSTATLHSFFVDGVEVEVVGSFSLLGSLIDNQGHCASEIKRRLVLGRIAMGKLEKVWKDRDISQKTKMRIVKTLVFTVATYGCETWKI